jgi:hypothetical protein
VGIRTFVSQLACAHARALPKLTSCTWFANMMNPASSVCLSVSSLLYALKATFMCKS